MKHITVVMHRGQKFVVTMDDDGREYFSSTAEMYHALFVHCGGMAPSAEEGITAVVKGPYGGITPWQRYAANRAYVGIWIQTEAAYQAHLNDMKQAA